jgi:hypothetical protein
MVDDLCETADAVLVVGRPCGPGEAVRGCTRVDVAPAVVLSPGFGKGGGEGGAWITAMPSMLVMDLRGIPISP